MKNILHSFFSSVLLTALLFGTGFSNSRLRAQPPCHPDFDALIALYNSTDGPNWVINTGWADGAAGTDCNVCAWPGVVCDGNGRVMTLNLNAFNLTGPLPAEIGDLSQLKYLLLVDNNLNGSLPASIGNLAQVEILYLDQNNFSGTIPASIGNLDNLLDLGITSNQFSGSIPPSIGDMESIVQLVFADNQLSGDIPPELGNLTSLQNLVLSSNLLSGEIPVEIGNLGNLGGLALSHNQLTGSIPAEIGNLNNLIELYLDNNNLTGNIPVEMGSMGSLATLDLSFNLLSGTIPAAIGGLSNSLSQLSLYSNELTGAIPLEICDLTNLTYLSLAANQLSGSIPSCIGTLSNLVDLQLLSNMLSGTIPPELGNISTLEYLYLENNQLTGTIPAELGNLSNLTTFLAGYNDLSGCLPPELLALCAHVTTGDISNNPNLDNQDWADFCATQAGACGACTHPDYAALMALYNSTNGASWANNTGWADGAAGTDCDVCAWPGVYCNGNGRVAQLYLYANNLVGTLPAEIGDLTSLYELDLSGNQLSGLLSTAISHLSGLNLTYLNLAENLFTGPIPAEIGDFTALSSLTLASNPLSGSIPPEIGSLTNMGYLNLYASQLTGTLPPELGNLTNLVVLGLFNNQLSGCFPAVYSVFCSNGTYVNLGDNPGLPGGGNFAAFCANGAGADADADGYCAGTGPNADCDDTNEDIHPGETEVCNGLDDDCDGQTDEGYCLIEFSGTILWEHDDVSGVKDANVKLTGSATANDLTDINGDFLIVTTQTSGSFTLKPTKNINKFNGVTTADATAIQQHVTQINPITDPYKLVCADVNKSNSISTLDAVLITQALLGNPAANAIFNTSWRFVPTSHTMQMPPWGFPEQRTYTNISAPQTDQDFVGMKIGDVTAVYANPANFGKGEPFVLRAKEQPLKTGETLNIGFTADQSDDLAAFQFALAFDPAQLQFVAIEPAGGLPLTAEHFGTYNTVEGEIRAVWSQATGLRVEEAAPVFYLRFTALQSGAKLSEVLQLDETILSALAYTGKLAESKVELAFSEATSTIDPEAVSALHMQVRPNPFQEETTITFTMPAAGEAQLRVLDINGREILRINNTYPAGHHSETLRLGALTAAGVLTCELITPFGMVTRKVVLARL